jgi:hypothetical protein
VTGGGARRPAARSLLPMPLAVVVLFGAVSCTNAEHVDKPKDLSTVGVPLAQAGCDTPIKTQATGGAQHFDPGTNLTYDTAPVSSGHHWAVWVTGPLERHFYTVKDRPPVEALVHNLEHGYTIVWYRAPQAGDESYSYVTEKQIAAFFPTDRALEHKVIVAPWTPEDDKKVFSKNSKYLWPKGKQIAFSHWSLGTGKGGAMKGGKADMTGQHGIRQFCDDLSGEAVADFVKEYPYTDAPEGLVP